MACVPDDLKVHAEVLVDKDVPYRFNAMPRDLAVLFDECIGQVL